MRDDVERTSELTRFISKILRAAGVFRSRNLASAAPLVEGIGEIATCPLFDGGKAGALLQCSSLQQAIILQCVGWVSAHQGVHARLRRAMGA
jgi:hypothetical protein